MIKDRIKTLTDDYAREVAEILLKTSTSSIFDFTFEKITRQPFVEQHGCDAEESINVYFSAVVKNEQYKNSGWKDKKVWIQIIERDAYHNYPYFNAFYKEETDNTWKYNSLSNHIAAVEFLQSKGYL